jgi:mono/diheme cytochrome c family protein
MNPRFKPFFLAGSALLILCSSAKASEPSVTVQTPKKTVAFSRSELLKRADAEPLVVANDPGYKGAPMKYKAVPAWKLFSGLDIAPDAIVQFKCLDGFSAPLITERLLSSSESGSIAYVAIEDPARPWPPVKPGSKASAGPFYLVWKNPHLSKVSQSEWPYQLAGFEVKPSLKESFPKIFPDDKLKPEDSVARGFRVFTKNCFACHTINKAGESQIGPDLNVPFNPTEYMSEKHLRILIRNPQNLRHWPQSKMQGFAEKDLGAQELDQLISYLKHMAGRKSAN